ncbi:MULTISPECIES: hypothetical protein [Lentzea]|uniref:DUF3618 domain-containing protein n=1 Tax=Lentzea albida TaxID=65499 RepID=A0A1H9XAV2_9PSEU|nr:MULTISPECIES: hypothetical protein [Lentzea]USX54058.1 hypothetical protein ND450_08135 [Lentzea sp. HUAS12]SES43328.1 hypothetical protein SAMN04488000_13135 [Lentzea albida]
MNHEGTEVVHQARDAAGEVAVTAQEQIGHVVRETKSQADNVLRSAKDRVAGEADAQAKKVSTQLDRIADELSSMAESASPDALSAGAVRRVADTGRQAARFLDERGASGLLSSAQHFARRRPGAFLLGAAVAGFLVGRVAKSATGSPDSRSAVQPPPAAPVADVPPFAAAPASPTPDLGPSFDDEGVIGTDRGRQQYDPYTQDTVPAGGARNVQP